MLDTFFIFYYCLPHLNILQTVPFVFQILPFYRLRIKRTVRQNPLSHPPLILLILPPLLPLLVAQEAEGLLPVVQDPWLRVAKKRIKGIWEQMEEITQQFRINI